MNNPHPYDLVIGLDRSDKKADLHLITTATGHRHSVVIPTTPEALTARQLLRTRARQQAREQKAYMQSTLNDSGTESLWRQLAPMLEEAMARLSEKERTLVVLRFFENKSAAETATLLGIQEWAAYKRASRAMEKLRQFFAKRGIVSVTATLAAAISANSVQAAPAMLAKAVTATPAQQLAANPRKLLHVNMSPFELPPTLVAKWLANPSGENTIMKTTSNGQFKALNNKPNGKSRLTR